MIDRTNSSDTGLKTPTTQARAIRRIALFLDRPVRRVEANLPGALQDVLCRLPWESRLRRDRDRVLVEDVRLLFENDVELDDLRRPRLKYLLEHVELRTRM